MYDLPIQYLSNLNQSYWLFGMVCLRDLNFGRKIKYLIFKLVLFFSDKMEVEISFSPMDSGGHNTITNSHEAHHVLTPLVKVQKFSSSYWTCKPTAIIRDQKLYGPACLKLSRVMIYPCGNYKCWIKCPCSLCLGLCESNFQNHHLYHYAFHLKCPFWL